MTIREYIDDISEELDEKGKLAYLGRTAKQRRGCIGSFFDCCWYNFRYGLLFQENNDSIFIKWYQ